MGNEANTIPEQGTSPQLTRSKRFASNRKHVQKGTVAGGERVVFWSETKKSLPKYTSYQQKCVNSNTCSDTEYEDTDKVGKSTSSKDSYINKLIESSFDDSSSVMVIDRRAKNYKLIAPAQSPKHNCLTKMEYSKVAARERRANIVGSCERVKGIDCSEYSCINNRNQISSNSSIVSIWLSTSDEHGTADLYKRTKFPDRFSFAESANHPKLDIPNGRGMSTSTRLSELSIPGRPLDISFSRSSGHRASDSITVSWPRIIRAEDPIQECNCLSCGKYDTKLSQSEYNQLAQRVNLKSKFLSSSARLRAVPVIKQVSPLITQHVPEGIKVNSQVPSPSKVIKAD